LLAQGNHIVDTLAGVQNLDRPQEVLTAMRQQAQHDKLFACNSRLVHKHIYKVAQYFSDLIHSETIFPPNLSLATEHQSQSQTAFVLADPEPDIPPVWSYCKLPSTDQLRPKFYFGATWGARLLWYLSKLRWPVNDSAKQLAPRFSLADMFLDFVFSSESLPPILVFSGTGKTDRNYVLDLEMEQHWTPSLTMFVESLHALSRVYTFEVVPGLSKSVKVTWLQKGEQKLITSGVVHAPEKLLKAKQVIEYKQSMLHRFPDITFVSKQNISILSSNPPALPDANSLFEYTYKSWKNQAQREQRAAASSSSPNTAHKFLPAQFV
jgi:hypothetical protein